MANFHLGDDSSLGHIITTTRTYSVAPSAFMAPRSQIHDPPLNISKDNPRWTAVGDTKAAIPISADFGLTDVIFGSGEEKPYSSYSNKLLQQTAQPRQTCG
nr:hypothetical protein [uncultured Rhodopila sp.]